ncbi:DUF4431 domain-containing protein [Bosea sp. PAMC 26642]|uniref:DUF4431 domain-containing protein n=1 Tax=Bosea sp. (strain PAMC 26642) TaxID=1792307 RepID=UPI0007705F09|nr:DUF4431 domain-containing protein [Bosea sp. PAMC 26642]AMJ61922.1 hypothetical protein AXW83_17905 [Bosea sp. PAMC 26642]
MRSLSLVGLCVLVCGGSAQAAAECLSDQGVRESISGRLSVVRTHDEAGQVERPYILTLQKPVCLSTLDADSIEAATTIQVYATDDELLQRLKQSVGKSLQLRGRFFAADTAYHHAPIVMEVIEIPPGPKPRRW